MTNMTKRRGMARWIAAMVLALTPCVVWAKTPDKTANPALFTVVLKAHVDADGYVDYPALAKSHEALDKYVGQLAKVDLSAMGKDQRLATLLNAYNAFTLKLILDHWDGGKLQSIKDIPKAKRWKAKRWNLGGKTVSLDHIEHAMIRKQYVIGQARPEPRVHWALVCASVSCPPLRREAYTGDKLDKQLASQEHYVLTHPRYYRAAKGGHTVYLTNILNWYGSDFVGDTGSVLDYLNPKVPEDLKGRSIDWIKYNWQLNSRANEARLSSTPSS